MGALEDAKAAELAVSKLVADLEAAPGTVEEGSYKLTTTETGATIELTKAAPAPAGTEPASEEPLPPQNE